MLDRTFSALSDATRRGIVSRLSKSDGLMVSELARPLSMSLPAVIKHLDVLEEAGLVTRTRSGRTVTCRLTRKPLSEAQAWIDRHRRFWQTRLDALAALVEGRDA